VTIPRACPQIPLAVTTRGANVAWGKDITMQCGHHHLICFHSLFMVQLNIVQNQ
jgi:hypothetical protein